MTINEKASALNSLSELSLKINKFGQWYVSQEVEIWVKDMNCLTSSYGIGYTPEIAIGNHWHCLVSDLKEEEYLVVENENFIWNGFMWKRV